MLVKDWVAVTYNIDEWRITDETDKFYFLCYTSPEVLNENRGQEEIDRVDIEIDDDSGWVVAKIYTKKFNKRGYKYNE